MGDVPICSECQRPLLTHGEEENDIVAIPCGHVFHKICLIQFCIAMCDGNKGGRSCSRKRKMHIFKCPKLECTEEFTWFPSSNEVTGLEHLILDKGNDPRLESAYEELENEKAKLVEERGVLEKERKKFENKNRELAKRTITVEIKETFLSDKDQLEDKFGDVKWNDITPAFQKELLGKLEVSGGPFMNFEFLPINRKALVRLIKADEKDETLLQKIIEDYFEEKKQSTPNAKVDWEDLDDSVRKYVISKLRKSSRVESLELVQVPLSSNILVHLITDQIDNSIGYLGKIVTRHLDEMVNESLTEVNDLFKVALLKCINKKVIGCVEIDFSNPQALEKLVELGMLRKTEYEFEVPYEFVHDSVMHCIIGTLMSKLIAQVKVSQIDSFEVFHEGYRSADPLAFYFANYMCGEKESCVAKVVLKDIDDIYLENLFMILVVIKLPNLEPLTPTLKYFSTVPSNVVMSRKVPQSKDLTFTLLHASAIVGDLNKVRCLLKRFGFHAVITIPCFNNLDLMFACVENTKECSDDQIQQRKQIITELLKCNKGLLTCDLPSPSLNVHEALIKFVIEQGADSWIPLVTA